MCVQEGCGVGIRSRAKGSGCVEREGTWRRVHTG